MCPVLLWVWLHVQIELANTVLVMPPSLSHHCLKGEDLGRGEKVSSCTWEERGGKGTSSLASVVWLVKFAG